MRLKLRKHHIAAAAIFAAAAFIFWNILPNPLFDQPHSTIILDHEGRLLGGRVASDGQWRFPMQRKVPERFAAALIEAEDRRFRYHLGTDPVAILRAAWKNFRANRITSGASTITMQVIRMARGNPPRTFSEKLLESLLATRLEFSHSKNEILQLYAANAPFGGNVVGLEAAAWRYFGRPPEDLSWAESATLAVLPNAPGLIHPGRSRDRLRERRNKLLKNLHRKGLLSEVDYELSLKESLPEEPRPLPRLVGSLFQTLNDQAVQSRVETTLKQDLQIAALEVVARHARALEASGVHNAAAIVIDNRSAEVVAYVANTGRPGMQDHGYAMDLAQRPRSTGSLLKPFLFATMLENGELQPSMLVSDIPTRFDGFRPENYDRQFRGAVPAREALAHSLNIPHALLLNRHGVARFTEELRQLGMGTLFRPADDYGLALILGGAEGTLWELTSMYSRLAAIASNGSGKQGSTLPNMRLLRGVSEPQSAQTPPFGAGAAWLTLQALVDVTRPGDESYWQEFASSRRIAWKTGTSHGLRDGWAIGTTPNYTVGVWAGNASGEGRAGLTGTSAAAPIMFDIFARLNTGGWFAPPEHDLERIRVCREDGLLPGNGCATEIALVPANSHFEQVSNHYRWMSLDAGRDLRVHADCQSPSLTRRVAWFVLPPVQEYFYRKHHPEYRPLPAWREDCAALLATGELAMDIVYPDGHSKVYLPVDFGGKPGEIVLQAVHRNPAAQIYWHLDEAYVGQTETFHEFAVNLEPGRHKLTIVDKDGNRKTRVFTVLDRERASPPTLP